jgi:hypothetical protein
MKNLFTTACAIGFLTLATFSFGQGFIEPFDTDNLSLLLRKPCIATLESGEEIHGEFLGGALLNGYLGKINIKTSDGEKAKFKPEDIVLLKVKATGLAKMTMMAESASSIKEIVHADFEEIINREYIIFETALKASKKDKARLMQLLNPGFDDKIKVYANPEANETSGVGIPGVRLTGGEDKSYLFVKGGEKAVKVRKGSYRKNFEELYNDCHQMLTAFGDEKIKWGDVAGHVFFYNEVCK